MGEDQYNQSSPTVGASLNKFSGGEVLFEFQQQIDSLHLQVQTAIVN